MDFENPGGLMASQRGYTASQANLQEKNLELARAHALEDFKNWSFLFLDRVTAFSSRLSGCLPLFQPPVPVRLQTQKRLTGRAKKRRRRKSIGMRSAAFEPGVFQLVIDMPAVLFQHQQGQLQVPGLPIPTSVLLQRVPVIAAMPVHAKKAHSQPLPLVRKTKWPC